ncbi:hypothetical protein C5B41_16400 [Acinetobacter ursingii]|nr:hypothetical protein C5B41_16400 [Acinetobacter ursingii]
MFPENKNKKIAQGMGSTRSVRRATRYEKARQDVGLFYYLYLRSDLDVHLGCELKSLLGQWDNVALAPSSVAFSH